MSYQFISPTILDSGIGAVEKIGDYLEMFNSEKVMIVTDKGLMTTGLVDDVVDLIEDAGKEVVVFDGVLPDPPDVMIDEAIELAREEEVDTLVSVGGGSSIDTAKAVAVDLSSPGGYRSYYGKFNVIPGPIMPHISIPTTSGTGSEVSAFAVISDTAAEKKEGLIAATICPTVALVDANMTISMPPHITAATGADALTHLMETCTTTACSPITDGLALEGTKLLYKYLPMVVKDGKNIEARQKVADASAMAAVAFSMGMFHLPHAIAHAIGAKWHIPHGVACAWGLVYGLEYVAETVPDKIRDFSNIFEVDGFETKPIEELKSDLRDKMIMFFEEINIPKLSTFEHAKEDEFEKVVAACEVEMELLGPYARKAPTREFFFETIKKSFK
ncbi:alcohol dehydrogenase [Dethiosulfatibacter aminovorans DSM 17477]|uniref:Alcohol dehydrogenase n=1 Tax=Dethiosulfatibacter aminovorans DSM 17477 TaxID=1121476 RepID=A0A1M6JN56_9FIRM|nr:iron-containing alcohol dehydrogenase [Dethiosulfatibacter aminovorans]SHJ48110.1 alcohol dehydrogenase [Dethiosulfatibacter aminovorans DSM 17477]